MKRILSILVCIICLTPIFGCSCSKKVNINYTVTAKKKDNTNIQYKFYVTSLLEIKYREPAGTPCYDKDKNIVMNNEVYQCYDINGNEFERARYDRVEKSAVEKLYYPIDNTVLKNLNLFEYNSNTQVLPQNKNYSYIYTFTIHSKENGSFTIGDLKLEENIGSQLKKLSDEDDEILGNNVIIEYETTNVVKSQNNYIFIQKDSELKITIKIKNIVVKNLVNPDDKKIHIELPIEFQ